MRLTSWHKLPTELILALFWFNQGCAGVPWKSFRVHSFVEQCLVHWWMTGVIFWCSSTGVHPGHEQAEGLWFWITCTEKEPTIHFCAMIGISASVPKLHKFVEMCETIFSNKNCNGFQNWEWAWCKEKMQMPNSSLFAAITARLLPCLPQLHLWHSQLNGGCHDCQVAAMFPTVAIQPFLPHDLPQLWKTVFIETWTEGRDNTFPVQLLKQFAFSAYIALWTVFTDGSVTVTLVFPHDPSKLVVTNSISKLCHLLITMLHKFWLW